MIFPHCRQKQESNGWQVSPWIDTNLKEMKIITFQNINDRSNIPSTMKKLHILLCCGEMAIEIILKGSSHFQTHWFVSSLFWPFSLTLYLTSCCLNFSYLFRFFSQHKNGTVQSLGPISSLQHGATTDTHTHDVRIAHLSQIIGKPNTACNKDS